MDKQTIEEMVEVIADKCDKCLIGCNGCECCDERKAYCRSRCHATVLVNAGYRKIPEGAVVLTGTKTEERIEDLLVDFDEMSFYPATLMPNAEECAREWKRKLIYAIGQVRKETAEKLKEEYAKIAKECEYNPNAEVE